MDSLEKALEATAADKDSAAREGMEATYRQLMHALDVSDMKPIDPKGEAFDPHFHMAITMVPAPEGVKPGMVVQVFQRGLEHCRPSTASGNGECCSGLRHCSFRYQTSPGGSKDLPGFLPLNSKQVFTDVPLKKMGCPHIGIKEERRSESFAEELQDLPRTDFIKPVLSALASDQL